MRASESCSPSPLDHDPARGDVDGRHVSIAEGNELGRAVGKFDLDDVAGAEIVHPAHGAEKIAGTVFGFQADQVRLVELAVRPSGSAARGT